MSNGNKALHLDEVELGNVPKERSFQDSKWRDKWWAVVYILSLVFTLVLGVYLLTSVDSNNERDDDDDDNPIHFDFNAIQVILGVLVSILFTFFWLWIVVKFADCIIKTCLVLGPVASLVGAGICFATGIFLMGVVFIIFAVIGALYAWCVWSRVPFAAACLSIAVGVFKKFWHPLFVNISMAVVCVVILIIDFAAYIGVTNHVAGTGAQAFLMFIMLVLIYWHNITTINVAHTTACGVMGTWMYTDVDEGVTKNSLRRAVTTSFGSICFGSFIVAAIRALAAMCDYARRQNGDNICCQVILCIVQCLLNCLGDIVDYINSYAFVYVALYGETYCQSAKNLWQMFKSRGITAIINDDLTMIPLQVGALLDIILVAVVTILYDEFNWNVLIAIVIGLVLYFCVLYVIQSYIKTLFVCWVSDPATFAAQRPEEYGQITGAANKYGYNTSWARNAGNNNNNAERAHMNNNQLNQV